MIIQTLTIGAATADGKYTWTPTFAPDKSGQYEIVLASEKDPSVKRFSAPITVTVAEKSNVGAIAQIVPTTTSTVAPVTTSSTTSSSETSTKTKEETPISKGAVNPPPQPAPVVTSTQETKSSNTESKTEVKQEVKTDPPQTTQPPAPSTPAAGTADDQKQKEEEEEKERQRQSQKEKEEKDKETSTASKVDSSSDKTTTTGAPAGSPPVVVNNNVAPTDKGKDVTTVPPQPPAPTTRLQDASQTLTKSQDSGTTSLSAIDDTSDEPKTMVEGSTDPASTAAPSVTVGRAGVVSTRPDALGKEAPGSSGKDKSDQDDSVKKDEPMSSGTKTGLAAGLGTLGAVTVCVVFGWMCWRRRFSKRNSGFDRFSLTPSDLAEDSEPNVWKDTVARVKSMMPTAALPSRVKSWFPGREPQLPNVEQGFYVDRAPPPPLPPMFSNQSFSSTPMSPEMGGARPMSPESEEVDHGIRHEMSSTPRPPDEAHFSPPMHQQQDAIYFTAQERGSGGISMYEAHNPYNGFRVPTNAEPMPKVPEHFQEWVAPVHLSDTVHLMDDRVEKLQRGTPRSSVFQPNISSHWSIATSAKATGVKRWIDLITQPFTAHVRDEPRPNSRLIPHEMSRASTMRLGEKHSAVASTVSMDDDMGDLEKLSDVSAGEDFRGPGM